MNSLFTRNIFLVFIFLTLFPFLHAENSRFAIQHGPYLQNLKETEVTIVWVTSKPSIGWVELAPNDQSNFYFEERPQYFNTTNGLKNITTIHSVKIKNLTPNTKYNYRIYAKEVVKTKGEEVYYGKTVATDVYNRKPLTFQTNDKNKLETSFIMLNDIHSRTEEIPQLLKIADYKKVDKIIFNGDMVSNILNEEMIFSGFMSSSIKLFAKEKPMYYARGNHETRGLFASSFQRYFSPKEPHLYFLLRQGPICYIFLDTGEDKPDSDIEYYDVTDYDNYRTEQAEWLAQAIQSKDFTEAKFRVVIAHIPPLPNDDVWHGQKEILNKFVPILNQANIDVMLSGHLHYYAKNKPTDLVQFPVIVNAHNTVIKGVTDKDKLQLKVLDLKGEIIDNITIQAQ